MNNKLKIYDIAILGGGAAGCMAAIRASELQKSVILLERNNSLGKKIAVTGNARCNFTNIAHVDTFIKKFGQSGKFLRTIFFHFSNHDLIEFFKKNGLMVKAEEHGKVFPITDKAKSVVSVIEECIKRNGVHIVYNVRISDLEYKGGYFLIYAKGDICAQARKVIVAAGGASYKETGSTGDGAMIAQRLGHVIVPLRPALVPLKVSEEWIKELQGLSFKDVRITIHRDNKKIVSEPGDILFTHFGLSGPLVLDLSSDIVIALKNNKKVCITIDLVPNLKEGRLESDLTHKFISNGNEQIKTLMQNFLPKRMVPTFLSALNIKLEKPANQITKKERLAIREQLKAFPLTVTGSLSVDEAMATSGGVSTKDINSRTLESKLVPGLYFAGEVIDGRGPSGGYNLQQAFSTGYLAGEMAAKSVQ